MWAPLSTVIAAVAFRGTSRVLHLAVHTWRFWRQLSVAALLVAVTWTVNTVQLAIQRPWVDDRGEGPALLVIASLAVATVIAVYQLPLKSRTNSERLRVGLDAGTVVLTAGLFLFEFHTLPRIQEATDETRTLVGSLMVMVLVSVFAVAKVALSGYSHLDAGALRLVAGALALGGLAPTAQQLLPTGRGLVVAQVSVPIVAFLTVWGGIRQMARPGSDAVEEGDPTAGRPFSVPPYAAVAAADGLMLKLAVAPGVTNRIIAAAVVVLLTAIVIARQVTVMRHNHRLLAKINHDASHDVLTDLPNRALLMRRLTGVTKAADGETIAVMLLDLDGFKQVNDTFGHEAGDQLLVAVARRLAGCLPAPHLVCRLGGDEFVAVVRRSNRDHSAKVADAVISALSAPMRIAGNDVVVGASIGIALNDGRSEPADLLRRADAARYAAKRLPGSRFMLHTAEAALPHQVIEEWAAIAHTPISPPGVQVSRAR